MRQFFSLLTLVFISINFNGFSQTIWTFDCGFQGWGIDSNANCFDVAFSAPETIYNSGHLKFTHPQNNSVNWLLGPATIINADENQYLHFELNLSNAGSIPAEGIDAQIRWRSSTGTVTLSKPLSTKDFKIYSGKNTYPIDMSNEPNWTGQIIIDRIHIPKLDQTANGYNASNAVYALDWIAVYSNLNFTPSVQDNSSECNYNLLPVASNPNTEIFGNRVSMKASLNATLANASMKLWKGGATDILSMQQVVSNQPAVNFSYYDLDVATGCNWQLELINASGTVTTSVISFATEANLTKNEPINYWMTPPPCDLAHNPNDDLLDNDTWQIFKKNRLCANKAIYKSIL